MKEEFDALFAEHQKLLGELQAMRAVAQPEQEYGVVAGVGKGVEIPACVKYYYIEPKLPPQSEKLDQDEVDIRSRLYQRIHELETQLAQPEQEPCEYCKRGLKTMCLCGIKEKNT